MKIAWVTRSFLDYRIPVFVALDELCGHELTVLYGTVITPERVHRKLQEKIGARAVGMSGEKCIGDNSRVYNQLANRTITIPLQRGLLKAIRKARPDILVCDGFFQWTFYALLYHLRYGTPILMCYERTAHTERHSQWYRKLYRRIAAKFFAGICCNGRLSLEYVRDVLNVPENRLSTGHMAADVEKLEQLWREKAPRRAEIRAQFGKYDLLLLFVGRMIPLKGVDLLIDAFAEFRKECKLKIGLVLLGEGPELENYRGKAVPDVFLPGAWPYDRIAEMYAAADVFIMPTLEDNWSLVIPEAMACHLPVATSVYNGCWPELVTTENGWTFDPLKRESMMDVFRLIVKNKDRLKEMGRNSVRIVHNGFMPEDAARAVYSAAKRILERMPDHG